ncbi:MAG: hypothetical protein NTX50_23010 [Candidatus Sumerlaeota bacterium]|nr:hypothetical protein [Candidatus Sumerlaeota bacterium]
MHAITKLIVADEFSHPVAVQIPYADWLEIQQALGMAAEAKRPADISSFAGTIQLTEDPLAYQARIREEWR